MNQTALLFDPTGERVREWHKHGPTGEAIRRFFIGRWRGAAFDEFSGFRTHTGSDPKDEFHAGDLWDYVRGYTATPIAPDTPNRVMRLMRSDGMLDYEVVNRSKSLYRILGVRVSETEILGSIRWDGRTKG